MANEGQGRRERLTLQAIDPETGEPFEVLISSERLKEVGRRSQGQIKEAAYVLPQVLQGDGPVFEGLCRDEDEDRRGVGWRCYCLQPDSSYTQDGIKKAPRLGQVFLVFLNEDRVAYNWRWETAAADDPNLPADHEGRLKRRLR